MDAFFDYLNKSTIEPFAQKTIGLSFDKKYLEYYSPPDNDNFDLISPMNDKALEVTTVVPKNIIESYKYEKALAKGKKNLKKSQIREAQFKEDGTLQSCSGCSIKEIIHNTYIALKGKKEKAEKRMCEHQYICVDLCICMFEGGLLDLSSFELAFNDLHQYPFSNIFFITSSCFIVFNSDYGFKEYVRITE